jgi:hypothetical protein
MHGAGQIFRVVARRQKAPQLFDRRHDDDSVVRPVAREASSRTESVAQTNPVRPRIPSE